MQRRLSTLLALLLLCLPASASALDLAVVALIGTGVDTGDAANNPYLLQLGAAGELTLLGLVLGVRGTRSVGSRTDCSAPCAQVDDLRTFGGDVGFDWVFSLLHISPRFGFGRLKERNGNLVSGYMEPGGVAELQLGILTVGVEVRYRLAVKESNASGLIAYLRGGLRF